MDYARISKETVGHLHRAYASLDQSPLPRRLRLLAELRVSQINGCAYCCALHAGQARAAGIPQEVLDRLPGWRLAACFDDSEQLVLAWAEQVTGGLPDDTGPALLPRLLARFSDREVVDLTIAIALMNALNRLSTRLGDNH